MLLTAWLHPQRGGGIDPVAIATLGAQPPARRRYANRGELERRTGTDPADVARFDRYCRRWGIEVVATHWRSVTLRGPIDRMIDAFGADVAIFEDAALQRFRHRGGSLHVPPEIAPIVRGIFGLHQWPRSHKLGSLQRHAEPLTAAEVAARYDFPDADGAGETIAVVALNGRFDLEDFNRCAAAQGLTPLLPEVVAVDAIALEHRRATVQDLEATLDVQIAATLAPQAQIVVYDAPNDERGFLDAIRAAIFDRHHDAGVLSVSYGWPEYLWTPVALDLLDDLLAAAALVGISVFCSAGDNGAEIDAHGDPHVLAPACSPLAIACGATAIEADSEVAWRHTGGGFSDRFDAPAWQRAALAHHHVTHSGRGVPDVAAQQMPGYYVVMDGEELAMGGTSAVAPVWAALTARINQRLGARAGLLTPLLYARNVAPAFREIVMGNNGRFKAGRGWNPCTGLGTPVGTALEALLRAPPD